jgi:hypothetical protein
LESQARCEFRRRIEENRRPCKKARSTVRCRTRAAIKKMPIRDWDNTWRIPPALAITASTRLK